MFQENVARMAATTFLKGLYEASSASATGKAKVQFQKKKDDFNIMMTELQTAPTYLETITHLCIDTAGLDIMVRRASEISGEEKRTLDQSARFTSTIESFNRVRDAEMVKEHIGIAEEGNDECKFVSVFGQKSKILATGYKRIVYGDHGPYVEFEGKHVNFSQ